jgi:hypothetical protein
VVEGQANEQVGHGKLLGRGKEIRARVRDEERKGVLFCKKEPKNLYPLARVPTGKDPGQMDKSLFASFSSEKEDPSFPPPYASGAR